MLIISASRRTDLIAFHGRYFSNILKREKAAVQGPFGFKYEVDLNPEKVHTIVLWSKNFQPLIKNHYNLLTLLKKYSQVYLHFTVTGFGGTEIEPAIPEPLKALNQLKKLVDLFGSERISLRFDPILFYKKEEKVKTNFDFFPQIVEFSEKFNIKRIIFSFVQFYPTVIKRFKKAGIEYIDPPENEKISLARKLVNKLKNSSAKLYSCSQDFLTILDGVEKSRCIDAEYLSEIHPLGWKIEHKKDRGQRKECGCSQSKDIGSYSLNCPYPCLYCYANKKIILNKREIDIKEELI